MRIHTYEFTNFSLSREISLWFIIVKHDSSASYILYDTEHNKTISCPIACINEPQTFCSDTQMLAKLLVTLDLIYQQTLLSLMVQVYDSMKELVTYLK